jgi:hypothetical protein
MVFPFSSFFLRFMVRTEKMPQKSLDLLHSILKAALTIALCTIRLHSIQYRPELQIGALEGKLSKKTGEKLI